jgi:hypothetical protein
MAFVTKSGVTELSAAGERYQPDDEGRFEVPPEVAEWLLRVHDWEEAEPPAEPSETPKRKPVAKK